MFRGVGHTNQAATYVVRYLGLLLTWGRTTRTDWQLVVEKVERQLEGQQTKVISRGGWLLLLRSVLTAISLFHLSVLKMLVGIAKRLEGLMWPFLWK